MKGNPTVVSRGRARSRGPIKEKPNTNQASNANPNWCSCGSKRPITTEILIAGQPPKYACDMCGEHAPLHAHIKRIDKREFKASNKRFTAMKPTPKESTT